VTRFAAVELPDLVAGGRDLELPFRLHCRVLFSESPIPEADVEIQCLEVLRHLPGRRLVVRASYGDVTYAVKLFFGPQAERYFRREIDGWRVLHSSGVPAPKLAAELTLGHARLPGFGLIIEWLPNCDAVGEQDAVAVRQVVAGLGRLHAHSALRTDPHLRNYLLGSDGTVYAIDGDGVRPYPRLRETRARENLARMLAELPPSADATVGQACQAYAQARWQRDAEATLTADVLQRLGRQRELRTRRYLAKTVRECSEFHCERGAGRFLACATGFWGDAVRAFAGDPERTFAHAQVVKAGNSATVVRASLGGQVVVIKRYNVKTRWHGLRRALHRTPRYRRSWYNGHRMEFLRLPTARPLALLEVKQSMLRTVAYLVMEDGGNRDLESVVRAQGITPRLVEQVVGVFVGLRGAGLMHGDTKASNFLLGADDAMCLVDLDAMKPGHNLAKDVRRFLANWEQMPKVRARFADALQAAGMPL
jgi:tRNA A-37 threonylcarbamoyl transferase component Bud32